MHTFVAIQVKLEEARVLAREWKQKKKVAFAMHDQVPMRLSPCTVQPKRELPGDSSVDFTV